MLTSKIDLVLENNIYSILKSEMDSSWKARYIHVKKQGNSLSKCKEDSMLKGKVYLCPTQLLVHQRIDVNGFLLPYDLFS
jgi:hypothetical protein